MNYILQSFIDTKEYQKINNGNIPVTISGLVDVGKSSLISALNIDKKSKVFVITYNEIEAQNLIKNIKYYTDNVKYFPKREISIYDYDAESNDTDYERIEVLKDIYNDKNEIIVTTIEAVMQKIIQKEKLFENVLNLHKESEINMENIKQKLVNLGYERKSLVENRGEFSVRGDIIDVCSNNKNGIRIELWGDEIDSIREFDLSSQRTIKMLDRATIFPATENVLEENIDRIIERLQKIDYKEKNINLNEINEDIEIVKNGNYKQKINKYFNEFYLNSESILDYLSKIH